MTESNCDPVKRGLRQGLKGFETRPWAGQTCGLRGRHGLCRVQRRCEPQGPSAFERQGAGAADFGGMVEWFKAPVLKTGVGASSPWVRIPLPPPLYGSRACRRSTWAALAPGRVAPWPFGPKFEVLPSAAPLCRSRPSWRRHAPHGQALRMGGARAGSRPSEAWLRQDAPEPFGLRAEFELDLSEACKQALDQE